MSGKTRTFTINGETYDVPEEEADQAYAELSGGKPLTPQGDAAPSFEMNVGTPEVIKTEVRVAGPAPATNDAPGWLRALSTSDDPTGFSTAAAEAGPSVASDVPGALNALAAGAVHGTVAGLERGADQFARNHQDWVDATPITTPVREWSQSAEREHPNLFMAGDIAASVNPLNPLNKVASVTRAIPAATRLGAAARAAADPVAQAAVAVGDSALREYGDTGSVAKPDWIAGLSTLPFSIPGAVVGAGAARSAAGQSTAEARALRAQNQAAARARSMGIDPSSNQWAKMDDAKKAEILAEGEVHAGTRFAPTVQQMNQAAVNAGRIAEADKAAAVSALTAAGATMDPAAVGGNMRPHMDRYVAGDPVGQPRRDVISGIAQEYDDMAQAGGPVSFADAEKMRAAAGEPLPENHVPTPQNMFDRQRYGAIMDAMRAGGNAVDPALTSRWDEANRAIGVNKDIATMGHAAANRQTPLIPSWQENRLGLMLGAGLGAGAAYANDDLYDPMNAMGIGAGIAAGRWLHPRQNAIQASWLSQDTAAMMDKLSRVGQTPVGTTAAAVDDRLNGPPPLAAPEDNASGPTSRLDPGSSLGRNTSDAMRANPSAFMPFADDYNKARTDDERAAVTERLYRTNPQFETTIFPTIQGGKLV